MFYSEITECGKSEQNLASYYYLLVVKLVVKRNFLLCNAILHYNIVADNLLNLIIPYYFFTPNSLLVLSIGVISLSFSLRSICNYPFNNTCNITRHQTLYIVYVLVNTFFLLNCNRHILCKIAYLTILL